MPNPTGEPLSYRIELTSPDYPSERVLRAIGDIAEVEGWTGPRVSPVFEETPTTGSLFDAEPQARLDVRIEDIGADWPPENAMGVRISNELLRRGLVTARDVLVVGSEFIRGRRNLGGKSLGRIASAMLRHFPEVPLPVKADPAVAAMICPSIRHVTWFALGNRWAEDLKFHSKFPWLSVQDIIDTPYEELGLTPVDRDATLADRLSMQRELRADAEYYAARYHRALEKSANETQD